MSKNNFKFIKVDSNYINFLLKYDKKVQCNDASLGKDNKPFLGILFTINKQDYYVPLSSANKKEKLIRMHKNYKRINKCSLDIFFIEDENGKLLSALNLNNMIPIIKESIIYFDIKKDKNMRLLHKELIFCNKYKKAIRQKANKVYNTVKNHTNSTIEKRCCNFILLEEKCKEYRKQS